MATPPSQPVLGIIGEGQLARMLVEAAERRGISTCVWSSLPHSPVSHLGAAHCEITASLDSLLTKATVVAFENEFQDTAMLRAAAQKVGRDPEQLFIPKLSAIQLLQDKLEQKNICTRLGLPTSRFSAAPSAFNTSDEAFAWATAASRQFPRGFVFKWSRLGYDGKGVLVLKEDENIDRADVRQIAFFEAAISTKALVYVEEYVPFTSECALVSAHHPGPGDPVARYFPLVLTEQTQGICTRARGPMKAGLSSILEASARKAADALAKDLGLQGVFAIEFFVVPGSNKLWINEIAPRVHNSGHLTQDAFDSSQFDFHVLAALGRLHESTAPKTRTPHYGMLNILGPAAMQNSLPITDAIPSISDSVGRLHWYGKSEVKAGRKLGHINLTAGSIPELDDKFREAEAFVRNLHSHWSSHG